MSVETAVKLGVVLAAELAPGRVLRQKGYAPVLDPSAKGSGAAEWGVRGVRDWLLGALLAISAAGMGCSSPPPEKSAEDIEKARQEHIQTMSRERDEASSR